MKWILCITLILLAGCTSFNQKMTPGVSTQVDKFDGSVYINQPPVGCASDLSENIMAMGFWWSEKNPGVVALDVNYHGSVAMMSLEFKIDGEDVQTTKRAGLTDIDINRDRLSGVVSSNSQKTFFISLEDFRRMARADVVKMRVLLSTSHLFASFGKSRKAAIINGKMTPFLELVDKHLNK